MTERRLDYTISGEDEWERAGRSDALAASWAPVLEALEAGKIVKIAYTCREARRSGSVRLGHRARHRGFRVEIREISPLTVLYRRYQKDEA